MGQPVEPLGLADGDRAATTQAREKILENMIRNLDGIVWAYVKINRPDPAGGFRPASPPDVTAFVCLQTEQDREIGSKTVQSIQTILMGPSPT